ERAPPDALPGRLRLDAGLHRQGERFGERLANAVADHVVGELADQARADRPRVEDLVAEGVEDRPHPPEDRALAPDPHREVARGRPRLAAAHRGVEYVGALGAEGGLEPADEGGAAGRGVDPDPARTDALEEAAGTDPDGLDLVGSGDGGEDD